MAIGPIGTETHVRIETRDYSAVTDQKFTLRNGRLVRTMSIGSEWEGMRIGIRMTMALDYLQNLAGTPRLGLGS